MKLKLPLLRRRMPLQIALAYLAITAIWIVGSDHVVNLVSSDPHTITMLQTWKGSAFILISAFLLYAVLRHYMRALDSDARELHESEERFQNAFNHSSIPHAIVSISERRIVTVNAALATLLGVERGALAGRSARALQLGCDGAQRDSILALMCEQKVLAGYATCTRNAAGELRDVILSGQQITIGKAPHVLVELQDVTERRRAETALRQSEALFSMAFLANPIGNVILDQRDDRFLQVNEEFIAMTRYERDELVGHTAAELRLWVNPDDRERIMARLAAGEQVRSFSAQFRRRDGEVRDGMFWYETVQIDGAPRCLALVQDVTELRRAEWQLELAARAFENITEGLVICGPESHILSVNPAFVRMSGYSAEEAIGQKPRQLLHDPTGRQDDAFFKNLAEDFNRDSRWQGEIWSRRKNGEDFPLRLSLTAVRDASGALVNHVAVMSDVTIDRAYQDKLEFVAHHDALTLLPNRQLLVTRGRHAMARAQRMNGTCALLYIDLDKFKPVNDTHGHTVGDELLKQVATRMLSCVRVSDTVARIGGDEFVVLLDGMVAAGNAAHVADKLLGELGRPFRVGQLDLSISASIGISQYPVHGDNVQTLMLLADKALYLAKKRGRNMFVTWGEDPVLERAAGGG